MFPQPGMPPDVYPDGTIKGTNPALDAATCFRDDVPGSERFMALESTAKDLLYTHKMDNITLITRIWQGPGPSKVGRNGWKRLYMVISFWFVHHIWCF
jgi:hypothetical protein